jgi:hypothetical protein
MNIKRIGVGTVVGAITLYLLGMLIWQNLFTEFFEANRGTATGVGRETMIIWAVILGTLAYAKLITLALEARGAKSLKDALIVGFAVGVLVWGTADFILFGITNLNTLAGTIADVVLEGVRAGIAGLVIAAVLSKVGD